MSPIPYHTIPIQHTGLGLTPIHLQRFLTETAEKITILARGQFRYCGATLAFVGAVIKRERCGGLLCVGVAVSFLPHYDSLTWPLKKAVILEPLRSLFSSVQFGSVRFSSVQFSSVQTHPTKPRDQNRASAEYVMRFYFKHIYKLQGAGMMPKPRGIEL